MLAAQSNKKVPTLTPEQEKLVRSLAKATPHLVQHGRRNAIVCSDDSDKSS